MRSRSRDAAGADRRAALVLKLFAGLALAMVAIVVGLNVVGAVAQQRARAAWAKVEQRAPGATPSAPVPAASAPRPRAPEGAGTSAPAPEKRPEAPTLPAEDGDVVGPFAETPPPDMSKFFDALREARDENAAQPSRVLAAWLEERRDALDAAVARIEEMDQPPAWGADMFRTGYREVYRCLLAHSVLAARAGEQDRAERELAAAWKLWTWTRFAEQALPSRVVTAVLRHVRPRDPSWLEILDVRRPRAHFRRECRDEAMQVWDGELRDTDPTLEALYEDMPAAPKVFVRELLLRPVMNAGYARRSRAIAAAVAEVDETGPCVPRARLDALARAWSDDAPVQDYAASVALAVHWRWLMTMCTEADELMTRQVLRNAVSAAPQEEPTCPDWGIASRELGGGRVRVSIRGSLRDVEPRWARSLATDFEFTRR